MGATAVLIKSRGEDGELKSAFEACKSHNKMTKVVIKIKVMDCGVRFGHKKLAPAGTETSRRKHGMANGAGYAFPRSSSGC